MIEMDWASEKDLSELSDKELYEAWKAGRIKLYGWAAGFIMKRIERYKKANGIRLFFLV